MSEEVQGPDGTEIEVVTYRGGKYGKERLEEAPGDGWVIVNRFYFGYTVGKRAREEVQEQATHYLDEPNIGAVSFWRQPE